MVTHLIFDGNADEAMRFYASLFDEAAIESIDWYGAFEPGIRGSVRYATLRLGGRIVSCSDALPGTRCEFTPAISLAVTCHDESEFERLRAALSRDGESLGGPRRDRDGRRSAWLRDRFGVTWWLSADAPAEQALAS